MTRILLRAGKDPFTPVVAESTLTQDVFNSNSGNYMFQHAVWKMLSVPGTEIVSNGTLSERRSPQPGDADRINDEFDQFVIPLANAFRPDFAPRLERLAELVEQLTIPVTVVGVGAQAGAGLSMDELDEVNDVTRRFVGAVLERSASIGVRGEFTRDYLRRLGFPETSVDVIGCPSLFLHGGEHRVQRRVDSIGADSRLAMNITPEVPGIGAFATEQAERHADLVYIGQDANDLRLLLWGVPFKHVQDPTVPVHMDHPLYREGRMVVFLDTWTWYDFLATRDFAFGTRFHGNVAALLAGTPAMLLTHDSRTLELAEYHAMPHEPFDPTSQPEDLHDRVDLTPFNAAMPERFARYCAFLERNDLQHVYGPAGLDPAFSSRLDAASLPRAVTPLTSTDITQVASRLQWLRDGMVLDITRHPQAYEHPFPHPTWAGAGSLYARRQQRVERLADELGRLRQRVEELESRSLRARLGRLKRRLTRRR